MSLDDAVKSGLRADKDLHGSCDAEIARLQADLEAGRRIGGARRGAGGDMDAWPDHSIKAPEKIVSVKSVGNELWVFTEHTTQVFRTFPPRWKRLTEWWWWVKYLWQRVKA